jgi:hypothetical protein
MPSDYTTDEAVAASLITRPKRLPFFAPKVELGKVALKMLWP